MWDLPLPDLVAALVAAEPGTSAAEMRQRAIESRLMAALRSGGRRAGEALVESLAAHGWELERLDLLPCLWRVRIPPPRVLEIWFTGGDSPSVAALSFRVGKPSGGRRQKTAARRQAEFYRRYEASSPRDETLEGEDRWIQLVGELEAEVNNGGFGQYLGNKGEARAREALACLRTVGAKRTARWLDAALAADGDPATLGRLDDEALAAPEDLPSLTIAHFERRGR